MTSYQMVWKVMITELETVVTTLSKADCKYLTRQLQLFFIKTNENGNKGSKCTKA